MRQYSYDVKDMKEKSQVFSKKFENLSKVKKGDKVGVDDEKIAYIQYSGIFQGFVRWWYNQNREYILKYLDTEFTDYSLLLDMNLDAIRSRPVHKEYTDVINENINLINEIIPGLDNLKESYLDYENLTKKIESIVFTLIDFKTTAMDIFKNNEEKSRINRLRKGKQRASSRIFIKKKSD